MRRKKGDGNEIEKEYLYLMKKNLVIVGLPLLGLGLVSCVSSTKTLSLSGELQSRSYQKDSGFDATHKFDLEFKNFTLGSGGIRIAPAYLQNGASETPGDLTQSETALKPLVSVKAPQGFFEAGFAVDFSGSKITCSFPEQYQFKGSEVDLVVYANAQSLSIDGGSAVVHATKSLDVTIDGTGSVTYYGDPLLHQTIAGLGTVNKGS